MEFQFSMIIFLCKMYLKREKKHKEKRTVVESSASEGPPSHGISLSQIFFCLLFIQMDLLISDGNGVICLAFAVKGKQAAIGK